MSTTPHLCPKCAGERMVASEGTTATKRTCPTCQGAGVLWSPMPSVYPKTGPWAPMPAEPIQLEGDVIHRIPLPGEPGYVTTTDITGTDVRGNRFPSCIGGMRF